MKVYLYLSSKNDASGMKEILIRLQPYINGKVVSLRAKSSIYISEEYFDKDSGVKSLSRKHVNTPDVEYHREQAKKITALIDHITEEYHNTPVETITTDWLRNVVKKYNHPELFVEQGKDFYQYVEDYIKHNQFSSEHIKGYRVLQRAVARYEGFIRATEKNRQNFVFDVHKVTKDDIEGFRDYMLNEHSLSLEHEALFEKLLNTYPANTGKGRGWVQERGENAVVKWMKKLKTIFTWLLETEQTTNMPFKGISIGVEKYGTPYYISIEERNKIASTPMPTKHLETQRDIFVFQCMIGCRVGDLMKLTADNITNGILTYTPHKTKDKGSQAVVARIPLHPIATALVEKYKDIDKQGRLFPFISSQKYNDAIKVIFTKADVVRSVEVRNTLTGETEMRPINEVASSHLARRTFVGNAYFKVQDPNLIGKMSGHVEGSKAFARYRNIEDETLKGIIDLMG